MCLPYRSADSYGGVVHYFEVGRYPPDDGCRTLFQGGYVPPRGVGGTVTYLPRKGDATEGEIWLYRPIEVLNLKPGVSPLLLFRVTTRLQSKYMTSNTTKAVQRY
jgi:hypothetical protein